MTAMPETAGWPGKAARSLLRTALLFAAMAAPYLLFELSTAIAVAVGIVGLYMLWRTAGLYMEGRGTPARPRKITLLLVAYRNSVPFIVVGLIAATVLAWPLWAYDPAVITQRLRDSGLVAAMAVAACLVLLPTLFLVFTPLLARRDGGIASSFLAGVREQGLGRLHRSWLNGSAWAMGIIVALSPALMAEKLRQIELLRDGDNIVTIWELAAAFPSLLLSLPFSAAMLSLAWSTEGSEKENDAIVRGYAGHVPDASPRTAATGRVLGALAACGCAASIVLLLHPTHLYFVAKGTARGVENLTIAAQAVAGLFARGNSEGWSDTELAAELNRLGSWTPDAPNAGLATLVADPAEVFADACTIRIAAGVAGPADHDATTPPGREDASSDLKFCIAVSCASPVAWPARPALVLLSSHSSRARYWRDEAYLDVFAEGRAAASGGYCTADGGLADSYQG
jgi:hypothetical protein